MKQFRIFTFIILLLLLVIPLPIIAQNVEIRTTSMEIVDKKLEINYDILNSKKFQRFDVWVEITDSKGFLLEARTFNGDFGKNQKGGKNKHIIWDYNADELVINETINVQLRADRSIVDGVVSPENELLKSIVLPGWGLSLDDKGEPYWIIGIAAYGSLATAILLQSSSNKNYKNYEATNDPDLSSTYFKKSQSQATSSSILMYTAIGTWVVSGIWTLIKANNNNASKTALNKNQKVTLCSQFDPVTRSSGIKLQYNF